MKRFAFVVVWTFVFTFVFLILFCVLAGVASVIVLEGDSAQNDAAIDEASRQWAMPIFFGSMLAAVAVSSLGLLPGTRRQPAVTTRPDVAEDGELSADCDPADNNGPADSDYPPAQPIVAVPIGTLQDPPPELAELGAPLAVHAPGWLASMSGFARLATFVLGLILLFAPVAIINAVGREALPQSARSVLLIAGVLAGLTCLLIAIWPKSRYTYLVFNDALVVSDRKMMRIIPWDQIQSLIPELPLLKDLTLVTRDGQQLPITNVRGYHQLFDTLFLRMREHLLPLMINRAHAGRMVEFGPLRVSSYALNYRGTTVSWDDVTRLVIVTGSGYRHLTIYRHGILSFWPFCRLNLNRVPNDLMLLELLKQVAPPRLLVPAEPRW